MRPILFTAALMAVATAAQAQAAWTAQRFAEANFATQAPIALAFTSQKEDNGWVLRDYQGRGAADFYLAVAGRKLGQPDSTDAEEVRADIDNFVKAFPGAAVIYRRSGPGPNQEELVMEANGHRFWVRSTHRHPWALVSTYGARLPLSAEAERNGYRFLDATRLLD